MTIAVAPYEERRPIRMLVLEEAIRAAIEVLMDADFQLVEVNQAINILRATIEGES